MKTLLAAMFLIASAIPALAASPCSCDERPKIAVTGESLVYATPNKVILNFGIEVRDKDLLAAKQKNAEIWKKAAAALKESGVADKDVETDNLSIQPRCEIDEHTNVPIGYISRTLFIVTLSDPGQVESLTTKMFAAGVNHVNMVEFQTTEFKRLREQARELALKAAREKAQKMAAVLGCTIGKPLSVSESDAVSSYWSSWIDWDGAATSLTMSQNKDRDSRAAGGGDTESMALGKISIRASVSVEFELKDN